MDLATKLFSLSFGIEPNKATLKDFSDILNSAGKPTPSALAVETPLSRSTLDLQLMLVTK